MPNPAEPPTPSIGAMVRMGRAALESPMSVALAAWEPPSVAELQALLPEYERVEFIARGGMGAVYRAHQPSLGRTVAVKLLPALLREADAGYAQRFKQEARTLASLSHPGIIGIHGAGELKDGSLYFAMEHVQGSDLGKTLAARGRLEAETVLRLGIEICAALQAAHERGIIHRDIKPANLMLPEDGHVKIADFGLARTPQSGELELTRTNLVMGTPFFVAPELVQGSAPSVRSDLYALGVTLYQLLTGQIPQGAFLPPSKVVAGLDPRWDVIIQQALQTDPAQRQADALELKTQLQALQKPALTKVWLKSLCVCLLIAAVVGLTQLTWLPVVGTPTDLLVHFDPAANVLSGKWERTEEGLFVHPGTHGPFIISTPFKAGTDFDFEIEFSTANPDVSTFNQFFYAGEILVEWTVNAHPTWAQPYHGFPRLDGANLVSSTETHTRTPISLVPGKRYRTRVEVRQGQLSGWFGHQRLVHWRGDLSRFTRAAHFPIPQGHFALLSWTGGATFHRATVTRRHPGTYSAPPPASIKTPSQTAGITPQAEALPPLPAHLTIPLENSLGMKFIHLPGTRAHIAIHETRRRDYEAYATANPQSSDAWRNPRAHGLPAGHLPDHPVVCVNWEDATAFCKWLTAKEKRLHRLPKDREWSIAVGLAAQEAAEEPPANLSGRWLRFFPWGSEWPPHLRAGNYADSAFFTNDATLHAGNAADGYLTTAPVMSFLPNRLGIYDLGGNVWEWCQEPLHPGEQPRILRGAGWDNYTRTDLTASYRHRDPPHYRLPTNGFRCVLEIEPKETAPKTSAQGFSKK